MHFLNFFTLNFEFDNARDRLRSVLEAKRAAVTVASVVTSMTAISMTATAEVVTPAKLTEIKTSPATPTAVPDTNETKKPNTVVNEIAAVNEGKNTSPANPTAAPDNKETKKPNAVLNEVVAVNEGKTTSPLPLLPSRGLRNLRKRRKDPKNQLRRIKNPTRENFGQKWN